MNGGGGMAGVTFLTGAATTHASGRRSHPAGPVLEIAALAAAVALNWYVAAAVAHPLCWIGAALIFLWLLMLVVRLSTAAFILLLPVILTRTATMISLGVIEAGTYMPEVNRAGEAGDASASFVAFTCIFFLSFTFVFRLFEARVTAFARSPLLDQIVALLGWPIVILAMAICALAYLSGLESGFPLLSGVDRFLYRREYGSPLVLDLLDYKFLLAGLLGSVAFAQRYAPVLKASAKLTVLLFTALYFLFGDKFFTILAEVAFFLMPLLLQRQATLGRTLVRMAPLALALVSATSAATLYIYSGYGRLPLDRTIVLVGERIAGQGELWFVASHDARRMTNWDEHLVQRYQLALRDKAPPRAAFANGVETFYFIDRYAPPKLARAFRKSGGWVQLTMGAEAMALVMFGFWGVAAVMAILGVMLGVAALYLRRAFASAFPVSLLFAVWAYLQVYFCAQQASLWSVAAPGQVKRLVLFAALEIGLLAITRAQTMAILRRRRATAFAEGAHA